MKGKARTRLDIFRVVLGPYMQYCPCEASEQKPEQKLKSGIKDIELSYCHYSISLQITRILEKRTSKLDEKLSRYANLMFLPKSGIWPILCQLMAILPMVRDINFKFVLPCIYNNFDIKIKFEVNQTQIGHSIPQKNSKTHQSGHISKPHFAQHFLEP